METIDTKTPIKNGELAASRELLCSRSLNESKVEEVIATLWTILWAILFVHHAPTWLLWLTGLKAIADHICVVLAAIRQIRNEKIYGNH